MQKKVLFYASRLRIRNRCIKAKTSKERQLDKLKADDPSTPDVNEAWEGGKAPKKKKVKIMAIGNIPKEEYLEMLKKMLKMQTGDTAIKVIKKEMESLGYKGKFNWDKEK